MREIVEILMRRDGLSRNEAKNIIKECQEAVNEAVVKGDYNAAVDAIYSILGLEEDYLELFLI
jgi:nucleoid DNA-binding protein